MAKDEIGSKLLRVFQNWFGVNGTSTDFGELGSLPLDTKINTQDPATIQSLSAFLTGLAAIVNTGGKKIALEDLNSLFLLAFRQIAYILQEGIPEYDATTTYYINSLCKDSGITYQSIADDNIGNTPATSPTKWGVYLVDTYSAQSIAGVKTFSSFPVLPNTNPSTALQAANKQYVDGLYGAQWVKLPSGLIIQWGSQLSNVTPGSGQGVSFPISFATSSVSVTLTPVFASSVAATAWLTGLSAGGFSFACDQSAVNTQYLAIGF